MSTPVKKIGMTPPHPGEFIRTEILDELKLNVGQAAMAFATTNTASAAAATGTSTRWCFAAAALRMRS